MKTLTGKFVLGTAAVLLTFSVPYSASSQAFAQEGEGPANEARANERLAGRADGDLIGRLNLTQEQVRQIRQIRQQSAEEMRNSRQRMGRAQFALDEAIYADSVDETVIEAHARDLAAAQAAVARARALTELRIRRVLTPEQLKLLREIRSEARQRDMERQRGMRQDQSAFQERQRANESERNQKNIKPNQPPTSTDTGSSNAGRP